MLTDKFKAMGLDAECGSQGRSLMMRLLVLGVPLITATTKQTLFTLFALLRESKNLLRILFGYQNQVLT